MKTNNLSRPSPLSLGTMLCFTAVTFLGTCASAATFNLNFSGLTCNGGFQCVHTPNANDQLVDAENFSIPGLRIVVDGDTETPGVQDAYYWRDGYADLLDVLYSRRLGAGLSISFIPEQGYSVKLTSFQKAFWPGSWAASSWEVTSIFDGSTLASGLVPVSGVATTVRPEVESQAGITLSMSNSWNSGTDNVTVVIEDLPSVPLPFSIWLLATGIFGLFFPRIRNQIQFWGY